MPKRSYYLSGSVYERDDGCWYVRYRLPNGEDSRRKLGPCGEEAARAALEAVMAPWRDWTDDSDPTFAQAAREFVAQRRAKGIREVTCREYERIAARELAALGPLRLSEITQRHVESVAESLAHRASTTQVRTVLAGVTATARKRRGYAGPDLAEWFEATAPRRKLEVDVYSPAEVERVCENLSLRTSLGIRLAAYAGLRASEVCGLEYRDVDFDAKTITVRRRLRALDDVQPPKNGKVRVVPLASQLERWLRNLGAFEGATREDSWRIVPTTPDELYRVFVAAVKAAGLRPLRFHDLRHTAGSIFIQMFPIHEVMEMMGHADMRTTYRYLHSLPKTDQSARLSAWLDSQTGS